MLKKEARLLDKFGAENPWWMLYFSGMTVVLWKRLPGRDRPWTSGSGIGLLPVHTAKQCAGEALGRKGQSKKEKESSTDDMCRAHS